MGIRKTSLVFILAVFSCQGLSAQIADFSTINFSEADSVAMLFSGHSLDDPRKLARGLTESLSTEPEKFRALYTWVCTNITTDFTLYLKNKRRHNKWSKNPEKLAKWYKKFAPVVFEKLRLEKSTVCTGYSYLLRELAYHAGLRCEMINGFGKSTGADVENQVVNHSWNAVRLNGKWYLCDPTWSSGHIDGSTGEFIADYNDHYFLLAPEKFSINHSPEDEKWTLLNGLQIKE